MNSTVSLSLSPPQGREGGARAAALGAEQRGQAAALREKGAGLSLAHPLFRTEFDCH
jgi:hypothetical protein